MGRAAGLVVGFEHQHLEAMAGGHGGGAEPPQPAAHHQQIRPRGRRDAFQIRHSCSRPGQRR